ncbi:MAG: outer membrane beta-barrel protein [Pseudomonadota bacterium]
MTYTLSVASRARRPVALALVATCGLTGGLMGGKALAADIPEPFTPAPVIEDRVASSFSRFGPYVGVRGGFSALDDTSFAITGGTVNNDYEDFGLTGSVFAGYETQLSPVFGARLEAELGVSGFEVESHSVGGVAQPLPTGDTTAFTGMVNAYVDADLGLARPFVGGGIGLGSVSFDDHGAGGNILMDDDGTGFAWQVAGGVGFDMTDRLTLETMVRYQSIMDVERTSTTAGGTITSETDVNSTAGLVGLRYRF